MPIAFLPSPVLALPRTGYSLTKKKKTKSVRAGLIFPVTRIHKKFKKAKLTRRCNVAAAVYATGVIEYLVAELLELSGCAAADNKRLRISPRHLLLAIRNDEEINRLLLDVTIPEGGVLPGVHPQLLKRGPHQKAKPQTFEDKNPKTYEKSAKKNTAICKVEISDL